MQVLDVPIKINGIQLHVRGHWMKCWPTAANFPQSFLCFVFTTTLQPRVPHLFLLSIRFFVVVLTNFSNKGLQTFCLCRNMRPGFNIAMKFADFPVRQHIRRRKKKRQTPPFELRFCILNSKHMEHLKFPHRLPGILWIIPLLTASHYHLSVSGLLCLLCLYLNPTRTLPSIFNCAMDIAIIGHTFFLTVCFHVA